VATTVGSILTNMESISAACLGAGWKKLQHVFDLAKNDLATGANGYGARPLAGSAAPSITNGYTIDQAFELILTNSTAPGTDAAIMTAANDLYNKQDEILKVMVRQKLNLASTVLLVNFSSIGEPERFDGSEFVAIRQQILVKYRQLI
jgi:hypothetical protein